MTKNEAAQANGVNNTEAPHAFELFAEELPAQTDFADVCTIATIATIACSCGVSTISTSSTRCV